MPASCSTPNGDLERQLRACPQRNSIEGTSKSVATALMMRARIDYVGRVRQLARLTARSTTRCLTPAHDQRREHPTALLVSPHQADQPALNIDLIGSEDSRLEFGVGCFESNRRALLAQPLERRFFLFNQGDDDVAVLGVVAAADDDGVAVVNASFDHRVTFDFESKMLAVGQKVGRTSDVVRVILNGADRRASCNTPHDRNGDGTRIENLRRRRREITARRPGPLDNARLEPARPNFAGGWRLIFRQLDDLDGARPMRQPADETALTRAVISR